MKISRTRLVFSIALVAAAVGCSENPVQPTPTPQPPGPPVTNTPPVISSIRAQGSRMNEPPSFADLAEEIDLTATVTDAESQPATFTYNWSAPLGTFVGTGAAVKWRAPSTASTPLNVVLSLEVVETYTSQGQSLQNKVTSTSTVRLHNSTQEVSDVSLQFLLDFSDSSLSPTYVMRNFQAGCHGTAAELGEVEENRTNFTIIENKPGTPATTINFGGICAFRSRRGDACSRIPMEWRSRAKRNLFNSSGVLTLRSGQIQDVKGVDQLVAVYDRPQQAWKLCDSDWDSGATKLDELTEEIRGLVP